MEYNYRTKGICAVEIHYNVDGGVLKDVSFVGGCDGNHKGIENLVEGMKVEDVIKKLEGIRCGSKMSSCPDQLAQALKQVKEQN